MKIKLILSISLCLILISLFVAAKAGKARVKKPVITPLASRSLSMSDRYRNKYVNDVFQDNILLTLLYMRDKRLNASLVNWNKVLSPFKYEFVLKPNQVFAFHSDVLPKYKGKIVKTTNAHFDYQEGFKSDGYLTGDGVCHLASLIYWASVKAGLKSYAPTPHSFAVIPDIAAKYGVSIYDDGKDYSSEIQNLYITNNFKKDVAFVFDYNGKNLKVSVVKL